MDRPDLSKTDIQVRAYIEMLEQEVEKLRSSLERKKSNVEKAEAAIEAENLPPLEENEPETTINIITATASGLIKRTPRHLYARQRRGGMGIFDLDTSEEEPPTILASMDESQTMLILTDQGRVFRLPLSTLPESAIRGKGISIRSKLNLAADESLAVITAVQAQGSLAVLSQRGFVRLFRHHIFGEYLKPGTPLFDPRPNGLLKAACWTSGDGDLFIATKSGKAIRFSEKLVAPGGTQGIRLEKEDECIGIASVDDDSQVFMLGSDGKGTIRLMNNFNANKSPNAGGKLAMNTDALIGIKSIQENDDLFIITKLSKMIRFRAEEIPPKDAVVQGVFCISLRADTPLAITTSAIEN